MIKARATPWQASMVISYLETDPAERAAAERLNDQIAGNAARFEELADHIYRNLRDKFVCVSGGQLYSADTPEEVLAAATTAFPDDRGRIIRYVPRDKLARV
jgi:hypothetical protein